MEGEQLAIACEICAVLERDSALAAGMEQPVSAGHAAPVCLLSQRLGTALRDEDLSCDWNCVNIWYLQHPPFPFSHPLQYSVCTECAAWGNRKVQAVARRYGGNFIWHSCLCILEKGCVSLEKDSKMLLLWFNGSLLQA